MPARLSSAKKVVGVKQTLRSLREAAVVTVFVAADAEARVLDPVLAACREAGLQPVCVETMAQLGQACGIDIGAACAAILA